MTPTEALAANALPLSKAPPSPSVLERELENLRSIFAAVYAYPESCSLSGIDLFGRSYPLTGALGGDHLIVVDFARRYDLDRRITAALADGLPEVAARLEANRRRIGVLVADVSGHGMTDAVVAAMLHQAFLVGVLYELAHHGHVTSELFEILNTRFYQSSSVSKFITMVYGEIDQSGTFRFISAGHPRPLVYSALYRRFVDIEPSRMVSVHPIGMFPTEDDIDRAVADAPVAVTPGPTVNEVSLMGRGDVLLLVTDGAEELAGEQLAAELEPVMHRVAGGSAREIVEAAHEHLLGLRSPDDDVTLVAIKRT